MKNIWKIALLFCFGLMTLTSCEAIEDIFDDETETESVNPIVGVWSYGEKYRCDFTFNSDGSGSWYIHNYKDDKFTWKTTEDKLYLNYDNSPNEDKFTYKIEDNNTHLYIYNKSGQWTTLLYSCTRKQ